MKHSAGYYIWKLGKLEVTWFPTETKAWRDWGFGITWLGKRRWEIGTDKEFDFDWADIEPPQMRRELYLQYWSHGEWVNKKLGGL